MSRLSGCIKRHQIAAFFILCYTLSWGLWLPFTLVDADLVGLLGLVGLFGPALSCILVSRIVEPHPRTDRRRARWIAFVVAWIAAAFIFTLNVAATSRIRSPFAIAVYAIIGLVPAFVVSSAFSGIPGVRKSLSSLVKPPGHWGWYLLAVLLAPVLRLLSVALSRALGWPFLSQPASTSGGWERIGAIVVSFLYTFVFAGGLNEETGWTGFALPRLQARYSPLVASVVLWFLWILWHVPLQLAGLWNPETRFLIHALVGTFFARFVFTWLYNRSNGGILTAMLFHTSANVASQFIPITSASLIMEAVVAVILVVGGRMWRSGEADG